MPRSTKQNKQMREATRTAVLDSAKRLFAQNGYATTTTRSIAQEAGISTGLMYHYFEGKEALLRAVFDSYMAIISAEFAAVYARSASGERIPELVRTIFTMLERDASFWSLFFMLRSQPAIMRVLGDDFRAWTERLRALFEEELRQQGRPNPELESRVLYSLIEGTIQQYLLNQKTYPLDPVVEQIITQYGGQNRH